MKFINFIFNIFTKISNKSNLLKFNTKKFIQSGFYLDFFFKKNLEVFIRNLLIYSSQFFGEKYIIEVLVKKPTELLNTKLNKYFGINTFDLSLMFKKTLLVLIFVYIFSFIV